MTTAQEAAKEWDEVGARFTLLVDGTSDWDVPTPVADWRARDIVRHLVEWLPALLKGGADVDLAAGPSVDDDPVAAWHHFDGELRALFADPARADRTLSNPHIGELPVSEAVDRFFTGDVFQHTWDLARATGQDDTLDPDRCAEMLAGMTEIDELLRSSGQYGPRVPVPDDASVQDRFIGFIGRDPAWTPPA